MTRRLIRLFRKLQWTCESLADELEDSLPSEICPGLTNGEANKLDGSVINQYLKNPYPHK